MSQSAYRIDWNTVHWWCARKMRYHWMKVSDFIIDTSFADCCTDFATGAKPFRSRFLNWGLLLERATDSFLHEESNVFSHRWEFALTPSSWKLLLVGRCPLTLIVTCHARVLQSQTAPCWRRLIK